MLKWSKMKAVITVILFLVQVSVFAQPIPDSVTVPVSVAADSATVPVLLAKLKNKSFAREGRILLRSAIVITSVSGAGLATFQFGDEPVREFMLDNRSEVTHTISKYIEPLGQSKNMMPASGALYATGLMLKNKKLQQAGLLTFMSMQVNDFATGQLKDEFQRRRPNVTDENHFFEWGEGGRQHASMPSSHTSTAFTIATSLATVYNDTRLVPPLAYATATLVGLSRIHDNVHWATDVLAGAAVGFVSAKASWFLLKQSEKLLAKKGINMYLVPNVSTQQAGLSAGITF